MLDFRFTTDPHSWDVFRITAGVANTNDAPHRVAMLQWHPERPPSIITLPGYSVFTLDEMRSMVTHLAEQYEKARATR
jgi:hypothetical protein